LKIEQPTLILDRERAINNIKKMARKAKNSGVRFRPHFKTHRSAQIGEWFKKFDVRSITVSSVDMALYFSKNGWKDITIAFPVNILEIKKINELAKEINLNLLVESKETTLFLRKNVKFNVNMWIKIDVGFKRTGISWNNSDKVMMLAKEIERSDNLSFKGILTHAGHSYNARSTEEIREIYLDTLSKMKHVQHELNVNGFSDVEISVGDTPTCSAVENFNGVDEIRPGSFVFYDIMQLNLSSCSEIEIAVAVACPIVAKHEERNEIVIYGGATHLSKDFILNENGKKIFGYVSLPEKNGWSSLIKDTYVSSLTQEHGIVKADDGIPKTQIGDILMIMPVHSCLTANLMRKFLTLEGDILKTM